MGSPLRQKQPGLFECENVNQTFTGLEGIHGLLFLVQSWTDRGDINLTLLRLGPTSLPCSFVNALE